MTARFLAHRVRTLGDDHDRRVPGLEPVLHVGADPLDVERPLRDEDHVRAAGQPGVQRDPAGVPAHHLHDQRPVVAFRRGVQPVDGLHGDVHGRVEAEGVVGGAEVVVDRLRHPDDRDPLLAQAGGHAERVLAADRDQRVHAEAGQVVLDPLDAVAAAAARALQRVGAGRPEDRAAARQDAAYRLHVQGHRVAFERPAPPVAEPDEFEAVLLYALTDHGADPALASSGARRFAASGRAANHVLRIFVAHAQQHFSHLGSVLRAQFDERQANRRRHETEQRQRVFERYGIALAEQRRGQRRCPTRQACARTDCPCFQDRSGPLLDAPGSRQSIVKFP